MRTAMYFFYGLDVEIRPIWTPPELFIHLGGAIGICVFEDSKMLRFGDVCDPEHILV